MSFSISDLIKPSLWGLVLLFFEVVAVVNIGRFICNRYFPNSGFTTLVNAV